MNTLLLYPKLALSSMRKNKTLYLPYVFTSALWIMMYYILATLSVSPYIRNMRGSSLLIPMLSLGSMVVLFFSVFLLFYSHSFLSKQKNKEYALYSMLGMSKGNLARMIFWDVFFVLVSSVVIGLSLGMLCYKMAELGLVKILNEQANYGFTINTKVLWHTLCYYVVIFGFILLRTIIKVNVKNPIQLLREQKNGEKPPRSNWFTGTTGILLLLCAYGISFFNSNPLYAMNAFFIATLLVILGTYLLFISGSVLLCKLLQKSKTYYYKANHFIAVSAMVYRMKRNGVGLASICILSTMVLVMLSSTISLYFGMENSLSERLPHEFNLIMSMNDISDVTEEFLHEVDRVIDHANDMHDTERTNTLYCPVYSTTGQLANGVIELDSSRADTSLSHIYKLQIISLQEYNRITKKNESLQENQAFLYSSKDLPTLSNLAFRGGNPLQIIGQVENLFVQTASQTSIFPTLQIVVGDLEYATEGIIEQTSSLGTPQLVPTLFYGFDNDLPREEHLFFRDSLHNSIEALPHEPATQILSKSEERTMVYGLNGGLFFIGIVLSLLFIVATVLILYYKQIVEGYEDYERYVILQKVGMTRSAIKKSISSQLRTVFFLPIGMAGLHLFFAFPSIQTLLLLLNLDQRGLFSWTTMGCYVVFALCYTLVYWCTSNTYFGIVSRSTDRLQ